MSDPTHAAERERLSRKSWIQSFRGKRVEPLNLTPDMVCIEDIAHALALKVRYTGHTNWHYTVGAHSLFVSSILPPSFQLAGLLHDATEAYLPDIAAPIKGSVTIAGVPFREFEDRLASVIFEALGLSSIRPLIDSEEVKRADLIALATECRDVMGPAPDDWGLTQEPHALRIDPEKWETVERSFLARFEELVG